MGFPFKELVLASHNQHKIKEFRTIFAPLNLKITAQSDLEVNAAPEPYSTFLENALTKARHASKITQKAALADDSGICALALEGAPGVQSARFAGDNARDSDNRRKLATLLADKEDKSVFYYCILVLIRHPEDPTPLIAEGRLYGQWLMEGRGENGFGYDPNFYLPERKKTVAELSLAEKNQISHRAKAVEKLLALLTKLS